MFAGCLIDLSLFVAGCFVGWLDLCVLVVYELGFGGVIVVDLTIVCLFCGLNLLCG